MSESSKIKNLSSMAIWTGVLSVVLAFAYYLIPLGVILGLVAIISGHRARKLYARNEEEFPISTLRNATIGWICGIAGLCISLLWGCWYLLPGV